jgi:ribosomal protein S18 acetylase RimI-like enzyme
LAGISNYEDGLTNGGALRMYDPAGGRSGEMLVGTAFAVGPLAAADVDGDGSLEVFVSGRSVAGRYPEAAPSLLLRNQGGRLTPVTRWDDLGLVTAACFTDLDGDARPDLVLARDWAPPRFFRNESGRLTEWAPVLEGASGSFSGLWNAVVAGDFDEDGRLDLVLGNWGRNTRWSASGSAPRRLWYGDFGSGQGLDLAESWFDPTGFFLATKGDGIVGFVWTKIHQDFVNQEPVGELYVVGVDPDHAHQGIGRALSIAGINYLVAKELKHSMLYVDADNEKGLALYTSLGFN